MKCRVVLCSALLVAAAGCGWFGGGKSSAAKDPSGSASSGGDAPSGVDEAAYAPPGGLPDMRPIVGLDGNHWAPAFMPAVTQQSSMKEVLGALDDLEEVKRTDGDIIFVTLVPKDRKALAGLQSVELSFHKGDDGEHRAYSVKLAFERSIRYQPAFHEYLVHLCRLNYGPISDEKAKEEIITILGDDGGVQLTNQSGVALDIQFPDERGAGKGAPSPAPKYSDVKTIDEDDFAPPEGMPDARLVMGVDPDHWAPAFLPRVFQGHPEEKALALFEDDFKMVGKPKKGDSAFVTFVPKDKKKLPGVRKVQIYLTEDEAWDGRGLRSIEIELDPKLTKSKDYFAYLVKLGEANYGDEEPEEASDGIVTWGGDNSAMAQLSKSGIDITLPRY
jgi:hypothetical protein